MQTLSFFFLIVSTTTVFADYPTEIQWEKREANWSRYVDDIEHVEVKLWDDTRCDYVSKTHAIEIDWASSSKVFEAVGQAEYYSIVLDKKPGIILLVKETERETSRKYVFRCQTVCAKLGIKLWVEIVKDE